MCLFCNFVTFIDVNAEYGMSEEISTKGDVCSFGLLLLQMITGCSPTGEKNNDGTSLHEFVRRSFPKNIYVDVDPTMLQDDINAEYCSKNIVSFTPSLCFFVRQ